MQPKSNTMKSIVLGLSLLITSCITFSQDYCLHPDAKSSLSLNNVRALISNGSVNHSDLVNGISGYMLLPDSSTTIYASALWIAGKNGTDLHVSGEQFTPNSFSPGPLKLDGTTVDSICNKFDRVWHLYRWEVALFRDWHQGTVTIPSYVIPEAIMSYPAHGNTGAGYAANLAPFHDENGDNLYNPQDGDYPEFDLDGTIGCGPRLYGDECVFWIMNDLTPHEVSLNPGDPLQVELHCQAFAYVGNESLNNTTFLHYDIYNRSSNNYIDVYTGHWMDGDLGCVEDDFVECDVTRSLGITWNADNEDNDGCYGNKPFGLNPPAMGLDVLKGPLADAADGLDNDFDGTIDEAGETHNMSYFLCMDRTGSGIGAFSSDPINEIDYYHYLSGKWLDGTDWFYGGNGHFSDASATSVGTSHMLPGFSDTSSWYSTGGIDPGIGGWDEVTSGNAMGDRRLLSSSGPFTFNSGTSVETTIGYIWARDYSGDNVANKEKLRLTSDTIQSYVDNCWDMGCQPLIADFHYQQNGLEFVFAPIQNADNYVWDFGDGNGSTSKFGINEYSATGTMNVCLTASNACSSINVCKDVFVDPQLLNLFGFAVQRIEGKGNGGWDIEIQDTCFANLATSGLNYIDKPVYEPDGSPIRVELIDASMVQLGTYGFEMNAGDTTANWKMYPIGGTDTVYSNQSIGSYSRQLIPSWGLAVTIKGTTYQKPYSSNDWTSPISSHIIYNDPSMDWITFANDEDVPGPTNWIRSGTVSTDFGGGGSPDPAIFNDYSGRDDLEHYETILDGGAAPYSMVNRNSANSIVSGSFSSTVVFSDIGDLHSVDIVFTSDTSLWSRCPVVETQDSSTLSIGGALKQHARLSNSVDKSGVPDGSGTGMGWFPGYAINVETGERLNIAFGEDSGQPGENGADMLFNPTATKYDGTGNIVWGGKHQLFVFRNMEGFGSGSDIYDGGQWLDSMLVNGTTSNKNWVWRSCSWVVNPLLKSGHSVMESDAKIRIRIEKPYEDYDWTVGTVVNASHPLYNVFVDTSELNSSVHNINEFNAIVFPNPASEMINVQFDNKSNEKVTMIMVDITGKIIESRYTRTNRFEIQVDDLKSGNYIIYLTNESGRRISAKKFIKV